MLTVSQPKREWTCTQIDHFEEQGMKSPILNICNVFFLFLPYF